MFRSPKEIAAAVHSPRHEHASGMDFNSQCDA